MRISYSQYRSFLENPERYRLSYVLGITPEDAETPSTFNFSKRRGRCIHALQESRANGTPSRDELCAVHGADLVQRCEDILEVLPNLGPLQLVEESFAFPIGDGKHIATGRIDHVFIADGHERVGDFKTTRGTRTKKETQEYLAEIETSPQSHFYLFAAAQLGHATSLFTYHVIFDRKAKDKKPSYFPLDLTIGPAEVARTMEAVYAACEVIEFLKHTYGSEKPWPHSNSWPCCGDKFFCGYAGICGRVIPKGCIPPGFTTRWKEKIQTEDGQ